MAHFLVDEVGCDKIGRWKKIVNDSDITWEEGYYTYLIKRGNTIFLGKKLELSKKGAEEFKASVQQLNQILDLWQKECKTKCEFFSIIREKGDFEVIYSQV